MAVANEEATSLDEEDNPTLSRYICLVSKQGHEVYIEKDKVSGSSVLQRLLRPSAANGTWRETSTACARIKLEEINTDILEIVCRYFYWKSKYEGSRTQPPDFEMPVEKLLEVLKASHFLDT